MTMWPWGLRLGAPGSVERANVQYDGRLRAIPTDAASTYARLLDTGKAPKDDARIYSGQALDGDGIDDWVDIGDISASCKSLEITINPATTSEMILQLATGVKVSIASGTLTTVGLSNVTAYVNGEAGTTVAATEWSVLALTFDAVSCSDVRLFTDGSSYFDGMQSNVKLWTETLDSDDVAFSRSNPETPSYNRPGTSLTEAGLAEWWPLIEGSGTTAYDWGGNGNHGTLTNFADPDTSWANAKALSDPRIPQTALMEWALKTSNNACVPIDTADSTNFTRDNNELNFNGRSYADCGNGPDVSPSTALIIEVVFKMRDLTGSEAFAKKDGSMWLGATTASTYYGYIHIDGSARSGAHPILPTDNLNHLIQVYDSTSKTLQLYLDGVAQTQTVLSGLNSYTIDQTSNNLQIFSLMSSHAQLPLFNMTIDADAQKIIDGDLDAWVAKRYAKAKAKYNLP